MESFFQSILHPKKLHLLVFGVLVFPAISWYLYWASFSIKWDPPFEILVFIAFVGILHLWILTTILDKEFKTDFVKYVNVLPVLLIFQTLIAYILQAELPRISELQGYEIVRLATKYKQENGTYPKNITASCFQNAPKCSWVGTKFYYKGYKDYYILKFDSFRGLTASYQAESNCWLY